MAVGLKNSMLYANRESADAVYNIRAASSQSEGDYICNATNSAGTTLATTYLDVKGTSHGFLLGVDAIVYLPRPVGILLSQKTMVYAVFVNCR